MDWLRVDWVQLNHNLNAFMAEGDFGRAAPYGPLHTIRPFVSQAAGAQAEQSKLTKAALNETVNETRVAEKNESLGSKDEL